MEGQTRHKWWNSWANDYDKDNAAYKLGIDPKVYGKYLYAIRMKGNPDAYEIGVVKNPKGEGYVLVFDFFAQQHNLTAICGEDLRKLLKEYEYQVFVSDQGVQDLLNQGYTIQKDTQANGDIRISITRHRRCELQVFVNLRFRGLGDHLLGTLARRFPRLLSR